MVLGWASPWGRDAWTFFTEKNHDVSNEKNRPLVGWVYKGDEILPSYVNVGNIINQYKDPYEPTSMEGHKGSWSLLMFFFHEFSMNEVNGCQGNLRPQKFCKKDWDWLNSVLSSSDVLRNPAEFSPFPILWWGEVWILRERFGSLGIDWYDYHYPLDF